MLKRRYNIALILSLALHLLLLLFTINVDRIFTFSPPRKKDIVEVNIVDKKQLQKDEEKRRQFVEQDEKALNNEIDPNAKFLSRHDQVIKKQTISVNHGEFKNATDKATGNGSNQKKSVAQKKSSPEKIVGKQNSPKKNFTMDDFKPKIDYAKMAEKHQNSDSAESTGSKGQASQTLDHIKEIDPGLETLLTSREFVFYNFYSRMRNQLNVYWTPKVQQKIVQIYKQGRNLASNEDKVTKLLVTLDKSGKVLKIQLIGDSGVRDLDDAAVEAFKEAAPFPNPPKGMVDPDGTIKIRWDFILAA